MLLDSKIVVLSKNMAIFKGVSFFNQLRRSDNHIASLPGQCSTLTSEVNWISMEADP